MKITKAEKEMMLWATALIIVPTLEEYLKDYATSIGNKAIWKLEIKKRRK